MEPGLNASAVFTTKLPNYPNGRHIVELEIDEDTGETDIVNYYVVDDVGIVMNPLLLKGQIIGGISQGVGQMLWRNCVTIRKPAICWPARSWITPCRTRRFFLHSIESHPAPTSTNPLGVKGAGEAGCVGALPAVANALVDALSHLGVDDVPMPATSLALWQILNRRRGQV